MATEKIKKTAVKKVVKTKKVTKVVKPKKVAEPKTTLSSNLNPLIWDVKMNPDLVAQVIYVQQSNARQGNAHAKTRADVSGGGRKPWKQKGTGRARHGSIRSPIWRGGGVTFPPNWRNWERKINKQMVKKAICMLLSERLKSGSLEFINVESKGTKAVREGLVTQFGKDRGLVITDNSEVKMAVSNVERIDYSTPSVFSVANLVRAKKILVDNSVLNIIDERLGNGK
ncbi:50S ribosomal protein L4 [Candidatus Dojkabacteria bacterium]|nr:50S ribosomal protein L4 [Candidatus Dojkabacteria bacterium]